MTCCFCLSNHNEQFFNYYLVPITINGVTTLESEYSNAIQAYTTFIQYQPTEHTTIVQHQSTQHTSIIQHQTTQHTSTVHPTSHDKMSTAHPSTSHQ